MVADFDRARTDVAVCRVDISDILLLSHSCRSWCNFSDIF